jgi:hypothetical protein
MSSHGTQFQSIGLNVAIWTRGNNDTGYPHFGFFGLSACVAFLLHCEISDTLFLADTGRPMNRRWMCFALVFLAALGREAACADLPDSVSIKVGQEIYVSFVANGDNLVSPKTLPDGNGPDPAVTIQVTQSGPSRTLMVTNPYARQLGYRVIAKKRGSRKETELPVSSVRSGQQSVMSLSEPFDELVLYQFHLQG